VWWSVTATPGYGRRRHRGESRRGPVTRASSDPFALVDGAGSVLVDAALAPAAEMRSPVSEAGRPLVTLILEETTAPGSPLLERLTATGRFWPGAFGGPGTPWCVTERVLVAGVRATAVGVLHGAGGDRVLRRRGPLLDGLRAERRAELLGALDAGRHERAAGAARVAALGLVLMALGLLVAWMGTPPA
jgi:hypothetical protein